MGTLIAKVAQWEHFPWSSHDGFRQFQPSPCALRGLLSRLDNPDGRLPPERALAVEHGAVRRALEALEAEGLIWRQQGKGTYIGARPAESTHFVSSLLDRTNPVEVFEARLHLEPTLAGLAAIRGTQQDVRFERRSASARAAAGPASAGSRMTAWPPLP